MFLAQLGSNLLPGHPGIRPAPGAGEDAQDGAEAARERRRAGSMTDALSEALSDVVSDADGTAEDAATMPDGPATEPAGTMDADASTGDSRVRGELELDDSLTRLPATKCAVAPWSPPLLVYTTYLFSALCVCNRPTGAPFSEGMHS